MTDTANLEKILGRIRKLLDRAEHANTPAGEADSCRAKAEHLMREYRIEEEQAIAQDPQVLAPVSRLIDVTASQEFGNQYFSMLSWICDHVGARLRGVWTWDETVRASVIKATLVGYDSDIRMAELLFTNARMAFTEHLEPKPDATLTDQVNAYRMRKAGIERNRIANALWKSAMDDGTAHGKVAALYKAECMARGEDPALSGRGVNAKLYRKEYAESFVHQIWRRLRAAREGADKIGGLPALHGREARVNEAFYERFPEMRPVPTTASKDIRVKPAKPGKAFKWTKKDEAELRRRNRPEAQAAQRAGRSAADSVAIDGTEQAARLDRYTDEERRDSREIWGAIEGV